MKRSILALLAVVLAAALIPTPVAAVPTNAVRWGNAVAHVCVERHTDSWGILHATRIWNEVVLADSPRMTIHANCPSDIPSIQVRTVRLSSVNWVGRTSIWADNGHITKVVVTLNSGILRGYTVRQVQKIKRFVSGHEFGHALGLWHTFNSPGSIMCYCTNAIKNAGTLSSLDRRNLVALYNTNTSGATGQFLILDRLSDILRGIHYPHQRNADVQLEQ
jgi:predicted Zn-dependent protease